MSEKKEWKAFHGILKFKYEISFPHFRNVILTMMFAKLTKLKKMFMTGLADVNYCPISHETYVLEEYTIFNLQIISSALYKDRYRYLFIYTMNIHLR